MPAKVRSFCKRHRAFLLSCALFALLCVLLTRAGQRPDRYAVQAEWDGVVWYHTVALGVSAGEALVAYGRWV